MLPIYDSCYHDITFRGASAQLCCQAYHVRGGEPVAASLYRHDEAPEFHQFCYWVMALPLIDGVSNKKS